MEGFNACLDKVLPATGVTLVCVLALTVVYLVSLAVVYRVERDQSALVRAQLAEARARTDAAWDRLCDAFLVPDQRPHRIRHLLRLVLELWREYRAWKSLLPIGWWDLQALKAFCGVLVAVFGCMSLVYVCAAVWFVSRLFGLLSHIALPGTLTW